MRFRAWYSRGRTYQGSTLKAWERMPQKGFLIAVRYREKPYRDLLSSGDWFWWWGRTPTHPDEGQWADSPKDIDPKMLKRGEWVSDDEYEAAQIAAIAATHGD